jgi:hypothetical protein
MSINPYASPATQSPVSAAPTKYVYRPSPRLAAWVRWWILLTGIFEMFAAVLLFFASPYLNVEPQVLQNQMGWSFEQVVVMFIALAVLVFVTVLLNIVGMVLYCVWIYRANKNARALGARGMTITPGWAVGFHFIPILNLFKPYQAAKEIYQASGPDVGPEDWQASPAPGWILGWWLTWLLANFMANIDFRMGMSEDPAILEISPWFGLLSSLVSLASSFLAFQLIGAIQQRQVERHERLSRVQSPLSIPPVTSWSDFREPGN